MRVLIYGAGSVGLGIAACLLKARACVDIVTRKETASALKKSGLTRKGIFGRWHGDPSLFDCFTSLDQISHERYDFILVCCKSFHTLNAAQDLFQHQELFRNKTKIVLFQNGWGNTDIFSSFFDTEQIYNARVITGFQRQKKNEVTITVHADPVHIGNLFGNDSSPIKQLCESITMGDLPCEPADSIEKDLWAKMLYNCLLNPLSAILCVPYGKLAEHQFTRDVMKGITEEIFEVMAAAGYETHWKTPADFLGVFYDKLIPPTADHRSSMLQDILAGKKTEIDALNGAIIALGKKHAIDVSFNLIVYNLVKFIESERHRK